MATPTVVKIAADILATGQLQKLPEGVAACIYLRTPGEEGASIEERREECASNGVEFVHVPFAGVSADAVLAEKIVAAVGAAPRPLLIECASARRAGAAASLALGKFESKSWETVQAESIAMGLSYLGSEMLTAWVKDNL